MKTYEDVLSAHNVEIPAHLAADAEIPVLTGPQRQGDVIILPTRAGADAGELVPRAGIAVVRGESGGNTHLLVGDGVYWRPAARDGLDCGVLTVPDSKVAYLLHPEHGGQGIGPGSYIARRQREQADEIRRVSD